MAISSLWVNAISLYINWPTDQLANLYTSSRLVGKIRVVTHITILQLWKKNVLNMLKNHDAVIKWRHFPHNWSFVRGIHQWPVDSLHKGHGRGALVFSLICTWRNVWAKNRDAGDFKTLSRSLWRHCNETLSWPNGIWPPLRAFPYLCYIMLK